MAFAGTGMETGVSFTVNGALCHGAADVRKVASEAFSAFVEEWLDEKDYVIGHTSGSTGTPKEIRLLKSDMRQSARMTNQFFSLDSGSRFFLCLSPDYIAGKMMIVRAMEAGAAIVEEKPSNQPLAHYRGHPFDLVAVVPSQALSMVEHRERLSSVRHLIVGGGVVSPMLRTRLAMSGVDAYATYGMTETCSHVALSRISIEEEPFHALPPVSFETDSRGCLVVHTPQFSFSSLITNDVVELCSPDAFYWKGRYDNVINTGGIKVFPEEIERMIVGIIPDCRYYVSSRSSEKWGMEVVLVLECHSIEADAKVKLITAMKGVLPPYAVPKEIVCMSHFKETATGKIIRENVC